MTRFFRTKKEAVNFLKSNNLKGYVDYMEIAYQGNHYFVRYEENQ